MTDEFPGLRLGGLLLGPSVKRASVVRRVTLPDGARVQPRPGFEGDVCAFQLGADANPVTLEAVSGRAMTLAPGDIFLGCPGYRESTRWVVGAIPEGGLLPGNPYWILAECGVVGDFAGQSPAEKGYLSQVTCLGAVTDSDGTGFNLRDFALPVVEPADRGAPVFLVVGTSSEVGKTTAAIGVLRALRRAGRTKVLALKATGTSSVTELHTYQDYGATPACDMVDFGLPTTHPFVRADAETFFGRMLDTCLAEPADTLLIECGGDLMGANVPAFLNALQQRRTDMKVILVASDSLSALGAKTVLGRYGITVTLVTGPCTDTPAIHSRTVALCELPAINMARGGGLPGLG